MKEKEIHERMKCCRCMICGSRQFLLQEDDIILCARCVDGIAGALQEHLPGQETVKKQSKGIAKPLPLW